MSRKVQKYPYLNNLPPPFPKTTQPHHSNGPTGIFIPQRLHTLRPNAVSITHHQKPAPQIHQTPSPFLPLPSKILPPQRSQFRESTGVFDLNIDVACSSDTLPTIRNPALFAPLPDSRYFPGPEQLASHLYSSIKVSTKKRFLQCVSSFFRAPWTTPFMTMSSQ